MMQKFKLRVLLRWMNEKSESDPCGTVAVVDLINVCHGGGSGGGQS